MTHKNEDYTIEKHWNAFDRKNLIKAIWFILYKATDEHINTSLRIHQLSGNLGWSELLVEHLVPANKKQEGATTFKTLMDILKIKEIKFYNYLFNAGWCRVDSTREGCAARGLMLLNNYQPPIGILLFSPNYDRMYEVYRSLIPRVYELLDKYAAEEGIVLPKEL